MKYQLEIDIQVPRERVIELFDSVENMKKWQPGLISFEHLSGEAGQVGAKSKLQYQMGKRHIEMIETITVRNLPEEFSGTYEADGVLNLVENRFEVVDGENTRWITNHEFKCSGFMRIMAFLMPWMFKKQSFKFMEQFKAFAENA